MELPSVDLKNVEVVAAKPMTEIGRYSPGWGVDYGTTGRLLIKDERTGFMLIWRTGHTAWSSVGQTSYYHAHLDFFGKPGTYPGRDLHEGGRLSKKLIESLEDKIDESFGFRVAHLWLPNHTTYIKVKK